MPRPHATSPPTVSRRSVLLCVAAAATLAACTDESDGRSPSAAEPSPDEHLRREVVSAEADLIALYAALTAAHPELGDKLAVIESRHRKHFAAVAASGRIAAAVRGAGTADPTSPSAGTTHPPSPTASPLPVPADPVGALDALRVAEETAAEARLADCLRSEDPALAELVAAIAAGEAANSVLLPSAS